MSERERHVELLLVWPAGRAAPVPTPVAGYSAQVLPVERDAWWIDIQRQAVPRYRAPDLVAWLARYRRLALPDGIWVAVMDATGEPVATAGSLVSPRTNLFANAGELGWAATMPAHRGHGLASWLCALATGQLLSGGFRTILVATGTDMPAAVRVYFRLGYVPYLEAPEKRRRWAQMCRQIGLPFEPDRWPVPPNPTG